MFSWPAFVKHTYSTFSADLSNIPNASSPNEEPENLEVKSITPRDSYSRETDNLQDRRSSSEPYPSTFQFPSEDEPVTMISKSIPPSVITAAASRRKQSGEGIFSSSCQGFS